ncbi:MAG TPA: hypothetical protein PLO25_03055 [Candidatus Saccharibacteria bacterium]|nr:hypothetical protein [Candidatus Saccharibacteria bacterium]
MNLFKRKKSDIPRRRDDKFIRESHHIDDNSNIFRRNRTLTSASTYNSNKTNNIQSNSESTRTHVHKLVNHRRKIFSIFIIVFILVVSIWLLISNFTAGVRIAIKDMNISKTIELSPYEKAIQDYLHINPMGRLRFLLDEAGLSEYISNKLPEVESVFQEDNFGFGKTTFSLKMRYPLAGWKMSEKQYYVDSKGIPFENNYYSTPKVQIIDESGISVQPGTIAVSKKFLSFVGRVVSLSDSNGYSVSKAVIPVNTIRILELYIENNNYPIRLSIDREAGEQVEDMVNAVKYLNMHDIIPGYIDVRVSGKAFYK